MILLFAIGRPLVYEEIFHGSEAAKAWDEYAVASGLASFDEEGGFHSYAPKVEENLASYQSAIEEVEGKIWHYFYDVVGKEEAFCFSQDDGFYSPAEKGSREYSLAVGKWVYQKLFGIMESGNGNSYFTLPETAGFAYDAMPVYTADIAEKFAHGDLTSAHLVFTYLYNANSKTALYQQTVGHFNNQEYAARQVEIQANGNFYSFAPSIIVGPTVFLFIIPLLSKSGKTLGKRFFKIMVISEDGYRAKKWQMLVHYLLLAGPYMALLIQHPLITLPLFSFYFIIDYMMMVLGRNHQGFHDKLSKTVIAKDSSLVFADAEEERIYVENHPNSLIAKNARFLGEALENAIAEQEAVFDSRDLARTQEAKNKKAEEQNKKEKKEE